MGMSSSQARLLTLTARMHDIEYKAQRIEAQKLQLANDSSRVYEDYLRALDATKIQYKSINKDGSITFLDATLNSLENGIVSRDLGPTSNKTYLLYDATNDKILVTPTFANKYGITNSSVTEIGTLEDWLWANGCTKAPVPDTYSISNGLSNVENIQAGSIYYTATGNTPSVSSVLPQTSAITSYTNILKTTNPNKTYTVSNANELNKLAQIINNGAETDGVKIVLTNNITVPSGWTSISNFNGTFNGNGYKISGLNDALFDVLGNASNITNLEISGANINKAGVSGVGVLANTSNSATVSNTKISSSVVRGGECVGGLIGSANNTNITNCSVDATVTGSDKDAGGLVGHGENISVTSCYASGNVTGFRRIGGLVGCVHNSTFNQSKANCTTTATTPKDDGYASDVGGFIGSTYYTTIEHCSSQGTVCANDNESVAGFVGTTGGLTTANLLTIDYCETNCTINYNNSIDISKPAHGAFIGDGKGSVISNCNSYNSEESYFIGNAQNTGVLAQITNCYQVGAMSSREGVGSYSNISNPVSGAGATGYVAPSLQHNTTPTSYTTITDIPLETTTKGTLNLDGSNDKLCQYIAFKLGGTNGYEEVYNSIDSQTYNAYQLAELVELVNSNSYSSLSDLTSSLTNKYNSTNYTLNQTDTSTYSVSTLSNPDIKQVDVSSPSDIINRLAYDVWAKNGSGDINTLKSQISSAFNNTELASLSYYYGKKEWTTIINNLASGINKSTVSDYINKYDSSWTINYSTTDNVNVETISHPDEWVKDENYYAQYNKYFELKALQGYNFEIVNEELCSKNSLVRNYIVEGGAYLLEFGLNDDNSFLLKDVSVPTDTSLQEVPDEKELKKAEAKYEADMKRIDMKDRRYDAELAKFETERNAVKQEMDTLKTVAKDNVDRTFKLFS